MIRQIRRVSNLTLPHSPLLKNDSWAADTLNTDARVQRKFTAALRFAKHVHAHQYDQAWRSVDAQIEGDELFLQSFKPESCTKFLSGLPSGSHNAQHYWPHARRFARAMKSAGIELSLQDYLSLISLSFKAHDYSTVDELWKEIETSRPELLGSVQLWNQYIQAACQVYPPFWPHGNTDKSEKAKGGADSGADSGADARPLESEDLLNILRKMEVVGVHPNTRTYELIIMAFARLGRLKTSEQILNQAWFGSAPPAKWTLMYPEPSTLTAIVEAWAFNKKLPQGMDLVNKLIERYQIPVTSPSAQHLWTRVLRLALVNLKPSGVYPKEFFEKTWELLETYGVSPTLSMWSIRLEYLKSRGQFERLIEVLPQVAAIKHGETDILTTNQLISNGLNHTVKYLINNGRALEAVELIDEWADKGVDVRQQLESYIQRRTGLSSAQTKTYKEDDDDNDWF